MKKYKQRSTKHTYKTKDRVTRTPLKPLFHSRGLRGRDRMVVGFTTKYAISAYHQ